MDGSGEHLAARLWQASETQNWRRRHQARARCYTNVHASAWQAVRPRLPWPPAPIWDIGPATGLAAAERVESRVRRYGSR
jgi:hypothetical protein